MKCKLSIAPRNIISLYTMICAFERKSWAWLITAAVTAGISILVKSHCFFSIIGAFIALQLVEWKNGEKKILHAHSLCFLMICALPLIGYYGYGVWIGNGLRGQLLSTFSPTLFLRPSFWAGWLAQIHLTIGFPLLIGGMLGWFTLAHSSSKWFLSGLWMGYVIFGLVFTYHISTHDYYQVILIPIVALSVAPFLLFIIRQLSSQGKNQKIVKCLFLFSLLLGISGIIVKTVQVNHDRAARWQKNEREIARHIGELVQHSTKTVYLSISGGFPLMYYGELDGLEVALRSEALAAIAGNKKDVDPQEIFDPQIIGFQPEYFIVTELLEFKKKPELKDFLDNNFHLLEHGVDYLVYDLKRRVEH